MPKFIAATSKGLVELLQAEAKELGAQEFERLAGGISFESNWQVAYRILIRSRFATRLMLQLRVFPAYQPDELYGQIRRIDFLKYISPDQTFMIDAKVRDSVFKDQRFVALKVKDAIADQFTEKFGRRPNVDTDAPDMRVVVRIVKNQVIVSLDLAGEPLTNRGYRREAVEAPMRENLAAAIVANSGWLQAEGSPPLVDVMCGSGTLLIEAVLAKLSMPGYRYQKGYICQKLKIYQKDLFEKELGLALSLSKRSDVRAETSAMTEEERKHFNPNLLAYGFDTDDNAVRLARVNVQAAGLQRYIQISQGDARTLVPPVAQPGYIVTNPPYGERLQDADQVAALMSDLARNLKANWKGWQLFLLSGQDKTTESLRMKSSRRWPLWNGPIECRLLKYEVR